MVQVNWIQSQSLHPRGSNDRAAWHLWHAPGGLWRPGVQLRSLARALSQISEPAATVMSIAPGRGTTGCCSQAPTTPVTLQPCICMHARCSEHLSATVPALHCTGVLRTGCCRVPTATRGTTFDVTVTVRVVLVVIRYGRHAISRTGANSTKQLDVCKILPGPVK
jgi:hypothetical protein